MKIDRKQYDLLKTRHNLFKTIRTYFYKNKYIEVETPNLMKTVPPDPYIDPLKVNVDGKALGYLHTSPEMHMKKLLQFRHERIFQMCKVFRAEEFEEIHSIEFTMLEWYREGTYIQAMEEVEELIRFVAGRLYKDGKDSFRIPFKVYELEELFFEVSGINPFKLNRDQFFQAMESKGFSGIDEKDDWNGLFFKLFIQEIEPKIVEKAPYFIKNWPLSVSTMAKKKDTNKVERFELYINGVEIANGYTELLNPGEQRDRFIIDNKERQRLGKKTFESDEEFLKALSRVEGPCTGVSIGVDRLLMVLLDKEKIDDVMIQRFKA
jgi:elongation factor P--(R)-beta-lysine ligase